MYLTHQRDLVVALYISPIDADDIGPQVRRDLLPSRERGEDLQSIVQIPPDTQCPPVNEDLYHVLRSVPSLRDGVILEKSSFDVVETREQCWRSLYQERQTNRHSDERGENKYF